jgi:hypothetical protein
VRVCESAQRKNPDQRIGFANDTRRHVQPVIEAYGALALIPIDRAAFSYQPKDLKSVRRDRFLLDTLVRREPTDLPSIFRDTLRFTFVSLGRKRSFSWRHWDIKSMEDSRVK